MSEDNKVFVILITVAFFSMISIVLGTNYLDFKMKQFKCTQMEQK